MDKLAFLSQLDEVALDELAALMKRMARDAAELEAHALLPVSVEMLANRRRILVEAAEALNELAAS